MPYQKNTKGYVFSNNKRLLQTRRIHAFLSQESYWSKNIPLTTVKAAIRGSECFAVYHKGKQIGFARVITDYATFGYLADVYIEQDYRGLGLSHRLMDFILAYPGFKKLRRFMLATRDAHSLYRQHGFELLAEPGRFMERKSFETYRA